MNYLNHEMDITTVVGCAVDCSYCPQKKTRATYSPKEPRRMRFEVFKECLEKIPREVKINFSGYSEPFLNYECLDMILLSDKMGYKISLYTTLVGVNEKLIRSLKDVPFSSVDIHLPTSLGDEKIKVDEEYKNKLNLALELFNNSSCVEMSYDGNSLRLPSDFQKKIIVYKVPINTRSGNLPNSFKRLGRLFCDKNLVSNVLLPNGDVTICCQDFGLDHVIGNLLTDKYSDLFLSKDFNLVKDNLKNEDSSAICRFCEYAVTEENKLN